MDKQTSTIDKATWAIGLMSGTSLDGIDAALLRSDGQNIEAFGASHAQPYSPVFQQELRAVMHGGGDEAAIERALTLQHAQAVEALLAKAGMQASDVAVIGFHGQTVWHKPDEGKTRQLGDGALLAELTSINVVNDFRSEDMRHGGQGAPLVPIFHQALLADLPRPLAVLNIGGVANVTWLGDDAADMHGFDTGPGNALINDFVLARTGRPFDQGGAFAAAGSVDKALVTSWLMHEYFSITPPKSLDRGSFDASMPEDISTEDGAANLTEFTVQAVYEAGRWFKKRPKQWVVCGGGVHNAHMMQRLQAQLRLPVTSLAEHGFDADMIEAQAFAYLALRSLVGLPLTFPQTTGCRDAVSGGRLHMASGQTD